MKKTNRIIFTQLILFLLLFNFVYPQYKKMVNGEEIKKLISLIASDDYQGRETGTQFGDLTEDFFAKEFQQSGLKPAGENGYYHYYFLSNRRTKKVIGTPSLVIGDRSFYYGRDDDFREAPLSEGGDISGEVVFIGYGIYDPVNKKDDYANMDLKGKIVLVRRGCPENDWEKWKKSAVDSIKAEHCAKLGAVGMMLFDPVMPTVAANILSQEVQNPRSNIKNSLSEYSPIKNFPVLIVSDRIPIFLGVSPMDRLTRFGIGMEPAFESHYLGKTAKISLHIATDQSKKVRNVLAMIPGNDSKLKNEAVMIGGHIDHLGVNSKGEIFNGADDNASGSCVALGVSKAMMKNKFKPKRTIIFAGWSGEEKGLLGSKAWCENPTWDLNKVVVYFNLDMVGLGSDTLDFPGIYFAEDVWKYIKENSKPDYLDRINPSRGGPGGSDHNYFLYKGVPAFAGMTGGLRSHPDYHKPGDDPEKINPNILQFVGDWMYHCIDLVSNAKENLIAKDRNQNIKYLMANVINLTPLSASDIKSAKEERNLTFVLADFCEGLDKNNFDKNFISTLRKLEELNTPFPALDQIDRMAASPRRRGRQRGPQVAPAADLSYYGYDEMFCKNIAKNGIKIGFIGGDLQKIINPQIFLKAIQNAGMVPVLKNLSQIDLIKYLKASDKSLIILSKEANIINEEIISLIQSKDHLFIYEFPSEIVTEEVVKNIISLRNKLGLVNIFVNCSSSDTKGQEKTKEVFIAIDKIFPKEELGKNILNQNFINFYYRLVPPLAQIRQRISP